VKEVTDIFQLIISFPFIVVALATIALVTAIRRTIMTLSPRCEDYMAYKLALAWMNLIVGVGLACLARGVGQFNAPWGYIIILGVLAGFVSSWIWGAMKPLFKKLLKMENGSTVTAVPPEKKDGEVPK
jgi:hypothetical protein